MDEQRLTGLALMNVHYEMLLDTEELIDAFSVGHPRRMKLKMY